MDLKLLSKDSTIYSIFKKSANIRLYFDNAFRILGLPGDSSQQDIRTKIEQYDISFSMNRKPPKGVFSFGTAIDQELVQQAVQKLKKPEERIFDELFWFWPIEAGRGKEDEALIALYKNNINTALNIWLEEEKNDIISTHNLAIYYHLQALQLEYKRTEKKDKISTQDEEKQSDFSNQAFTRWNKVIESKEFWDRLEKRIIDLDYPMLTKDRVSEIKALLPFSLCSYNIKKAIESTVSSDEHELERHFNIIKKAGFKEEIIEYALKEYSGPLTQYINKITSEYKEEVQKDYKLGYNLSLKLIDESHFLLYLFDNLLNDHYLKNDCHDKLAEAGLEIIIKYVNKSFKWIEFCDVTEKFLSLAVGKPLIARIKKNLTIGKNELKKVAAVKESYEEEYYWGRVSREDKIDSYKDYLKKYPRGRYASKARSKIEEIRRCFFCNINTMDPSASLKIKMRKKLQEQVIIVPRCTSCMKKHKKVFYQNSIKFILSILTALLTCALTNNYINSIEWLIVVFWSVFAFSISFNKIMGFTLTLLSVVFIYSRFITDQFDLVEKIIIAWASFALLWGLSLNIMKYLKKHKIIRRLDYYKYNKIQQLLNAGWNFSFSTNQKSTKYEAPAPVKKSSFQERLEEAVKQRGKIKY